MSHHHIGDTPQPRRFINGVLYHMSYDGLLTSRPVHAPNTDNPIECHHLDCWWEGTRYDCRPQHRPFHTTSPDVSLAREIFTRGITEGNLAAIANWRDGGYN